MNFYENFDALRFNVIEGNRVTVSDFWNSDCNRFRKERIYLCKNGEAWMFLKGQKLFLKPNMLYYIPSYSVLYGEILSNLDHYFIHFEFSSEQTDSVSLFHFCNEVSATEEDEYLLNVLLKLISSKEESIQNQLHKNGILQILISRFLKPLDINSENTLRINKTINYINENISRRISLSELAEQHHLNEMYFSHLFKSIVGISPAQYILNKRISHAIRLLTQTTETVKEIAFLSGFEDEMYFSRIFKIKTGFSPRAFRKTLIKENLPPPRQD